MGAWLRKTADLVFTWRFLPVWYFAAVVLGGCGSFFAYRGPFSSSAWQEWSRGIPWLVDTLRLAFAAVLSLFVVWTLGALDPENRRLREDTVRGAWALIPPAIFCLVVAVHFLYLPNAFIAELKQRNWKGDMSITKIYVPYLPYVLYTVVLWCAIAMLPLLVLLARARGDWRRWKTYQSQVNDAFAALLKPGWDTSRLIESRVALQNYVARLKQIGERSIAVILSVAAMLVYEQVTPTHATVLTKTQDIAKVVVWFLLGPAMSTLVIIVMFGYQGAIRKAERAYRRLLVSREPAIVADRDAILKARDKLMWKGSGGSFALSILKSTSVIVLLIASGTAYIVKSAESGGWPAVFIPGEVVSFLRRIFGS